ncbi:MAG: tetratricopeptide repeat protein [Candidatus Melainabacteria bacterium]|nr:tetratricopeptide repeat protein [Candidatus Melainabacteria bacterium]
MIDFKGITQDIAAPNSQSAVGSSSGAVQVELRQAVDYFKMAMEYLTQGRFDDAEQLYRMALNVSETAMGMDNPAIIGHLEELSNFYMNRAKFVEAEPYLKRIYALRINGCQSDDGYFEGLADTVDKLANVFERTGRSGEAEKLYLNLLRSQEKQKGGQDQTTLDALGRLGNFYQRTGVYAAARAVFEELLEIQVIVSGVNSSEVGAVLSSLSVVYGKLELYMEQIAVLERQVQVLDTIHGGCGLSLASALSRLADVLSGAVRLTGCKDLLERAELVYRRALSIYEKHYGPSTATVENLRLRLKKLSS